MTEQLHQQAEVELAQPDEISVQDEKLKSLVADLNQTLAVNSQEVDLATQKSRDRNFKLAMGISVAAGVVLALLALVFSGIMAALPFVIISTVIAGVTAFYKHMTRDAIKKGRSLEQQKTGERFQTIKGAVRGMVDKEVEKPTVSALNDAYAISRALERYPELQTFSADSMKEMIGQTLLAGHLLLQMRDYQNTRWQTKAAQHQELIGQQDIMQQGLLEDQAQLHDTVAEATLQLSLIRGEILRMETQALLSQDFNESLTDMLQRVQSLREALETVTGNASRNFKRLQDSHA